MVQTSFPARTALSMELVADGALCAFCGISAFEPPVLELVAASLRTPVAASAPTTSAAASPMSASIPAADLSTDLSHPSASPFCNGEQAPFYGRVDLSRQTFGPTLPGIDPFCERVSSTVIFLPLGWLPRKTLTEALHALYIPIASAQVGYGLYTCAVIDKEGARSRSWCLCSNPGSDT